MPTPVTTQPASCPPNQPLPLATRKKKKLEAFAHPKEPSARELFLSELLKVPAPEGLHDWLADTLGDEGLSERNELSRREQNIADTLNCFFQEQKSVPYLWLCFLHRAFAMKWLDAEAIKRVAAKFAEADMVLEAHLLSLQQWQITDLAHVLRCDHRGNLIPFLIKTFDEYSPPENSLFYWGNWNSNQVRDPQNHYFWLDLFGCEVAVHILMEVKDITPQNATPDVLKRMACYLNSYGACIQVFHAEEMARHFHFTEHAAHGLEYAKASQLLFELVDARMGKDWKNAELVWRRIWIHFALMAYDGRLSSLEPQDARVRLQEAVLYELGRIRVIAKEAAKNPEEAAITFGAERELYSDLVHFLSLGDSTWKAIKPLLLMLRYLSVPALATDLRYWNELNSEDKPSPDWSLIPTNLINLVHIVASRERKADTDLQSLREEFASYCLERLKAQEKVPGKTEFTDDELVEKDSAWRYAYLEALRVLRINPGERGHRVLFWSKEHDPEPIVRESAAKLYTQLRHSPKLNTDTSPIRPAITAIWWLFQAHMLSTLPDNLSIDSAGAQRTLSKLMSRTTLPKTTT